MTPEDAQRYVTRNIVERVRGLGFLWRLLHSLRDGHEHGTPHTQRRSLDLFVTDGENDKTDGARTTRVLEEAQSRGDQVYFLFIGACEDRNVKFEFVQNIARRFRNTARNSTRPCSARNSWSGSRPDGAAFAKRQQAQRVDDHQQGRPFVEKHCCADAEPENRGRDEHRHLPEAGPQLLADHTSHHDVELAVKALDAAVLRARRGSWGGGSRVVRAHGAWTRHRR